MKQNCAGLKLKAVKKRSIQDKCRRQQLREVSRMNIKGNRWEK
jgi:hypothetical protein